MSNLSDMTYLSNKSTISTITNASTNSNGHTMLSSESDGNHWTNKKEELIRKWGYESELYGWLHHYNADYYNKMDYLFSIPAIGISAITSTALFSTLSMDDNRIVIVIFGILLVIGTILQSTRDFIKVSKLLYDNRYYSKLYKILKNDIDEQLNREKNERENGTKFLNKIKATRNEMLLNAPNIHNRAWSMLIKGFEKGTIKVSNREYFKKLLSIKSNKNKLNSRNSRHSKNSGNKNIIKQLIDNTQLSTKDKTSSFKRWATINKMNSINQSILDKLNNKKNNTLNNEKINTLNNKKNSIKNNKKNSIKKNNTLNSQEVIENVLVKNDIINNVISETSSLEKKNRIFPHYDYQSETSKSSNDDEKITNTKSNTLNNKQKKITFNLKKNNNNIIHKNKNTDDTIINIEATTLDKSIDNLKDKMFFFD